MRSYKRILLFILALFLVSIAISYCLKPFLPFGMRKITHRVAAIVILTGSYLYLRRVQKKTLRSLGLKFTSASIQNVLHGLAISAVVVGLLGLFANIVGAHKLNATIEVVRLVKVVFLHIFIAMLIGFIEEAFFRGFLLQGFMQDMRTYAAVIITTLLYTLAHFFKPIEDPLGTLPKVLGFALVGVILAYAYLRSGSLYLPIGIHAGWYYFSKIYKCLFSHTGAHPYLLFGEGNFTHGGAGWLVLFGILLYIRKFIKPILLSEQASQRAFSRSS